MELKCSPGRQSLWVSEIMEWASSGDRILPRTSTCWKDPPTVSLWFPSCWGQEHYPACSGAWPSIDMTEEALRLLQVSWEHPELESRETRDIGLQGRALGEHALLRETTTRGFVFPGQGSQVSWSLLASELTRSQRHRRDSSLTLNFWKANQVAMVSNGTIQWNCVLWRGFLFAVRDGAGMSRANTWGLERWFSG